MGDLLVERYGSSSGCLFSTYLTQAGQQEVNNGYLRSSFRLRISASSLVSSMMVMSALTLVSKQRSKPIIWRAV